MPLRDAAHPFGFPWLQGISLTKVLQSNILYSFVVDVLFFAFTHNIVVSIENPLNSWLWVILKELVMQHPSQAFRRWFNNLEAVEFSNCAWGGDRPKMTKWLSTNSVYTELNRPCPGNHYHKPYEAVRTGNKSVKFSTAEEAEYPWGLCDKVVELIAKHLKYPPQMAEPRHKVLDMASSHRQHRAHPPLIPEFHHFIASQAAPQQPHKMLDTRSFHGGDSGSKLYGKDGTACKEVCHRFGVYHTKEQFLECALQVEHPFDKFHSVDDISRQNIFNLLVNGPVKTSRERLQSLLEVESSAKQLAEDELGLHRGFPPHIDEVVKGKNILLWERLLQKHNYPDMQVVDFMKNGVDLVGEHSVSPIYPEQRVVATTSVELLKKSSTWRNQSFAAAPIHKDEPGLTEKLWEVTMSEVDKGFLKGPFPSLAAVREQIGAGELVVNRRFLLLQGESAKPRAIDDGKTSGLNGAYTQSNKLVLQDLDAYVALCAFAGRCIHDGRVEVTLQTGEKLAGKVSPDFNGALDWKGKCLDLEKAYRQVPVSTDSLRCSVALVHNTDGEPNYFVSQSLPFGACSSVYAFNRISASIRFLIQKVLGGILTVFYDDFAELEAGASGDLMDRIVSRFLSILGWTHATTGSKGLSFSASFTVLGASVDLKQLAQGRLVISNKEGRLERIASLIHAAAKVYPPKRRECQVLAGLLQYSVGSSLGATLRMAARAFSSMTAGRYPRKASSYKQLCEWLVGLVQKVKPRIVDLTSSTAPILVFTDASFDGAIARWGSVIIDQHQNTRLVAGGIISPDLVKHWISQVGDQIICEAELYAALITRHFINKRWSNRRAIFWIDNDASSLCLIKTISTSPPMLIMSQLFHSFVEGDNVACWFERVASEANIADLPSRGMIDEAAKIVAGQVVDDMDSGHDLIRTIIDKSFLDDGRLMFESNLQTSDSNDLGRNGSPVTFLKP